jgi:GT2 family glycosyltransferase
MKQAIAAVIVNHNTCQALRDCLNSIDRSAASEVIVVDNASSDGSVEMLRKEYPWVKLYANQSNLGYGAAANQGIASCAAPYVLLLNGDTILQHGALGALAQYLTDHPEAAIVGPRLIDADGTLQASCYPFPTPFHTILENSAWAGSLGRFIRRKVPGLRSLYLRTWPHDSARTVPWIKGAAMAIRRGPFEAISGFDDAFFMYFEDADLCYRVQAAGWEVHFAPVTTVVHLGGASTSKYRAEMAVEQIASTVRFYRRHSSRLRVLQLLLVLKSLMLAKWIGAKVRFYLSHDIDKRKRLAEDLVSLKRSFGLVGRQVVSNPYP